MANWMREAGFIVSQEPRPIPLATCGWPRSSAQREIGVANRENVRSLLSSMAAYPMTVFQGMASADFELLVAQARNEADNPRFKVRLYRPKATVGKICASTGKGRSGGRYDDHDEI
ncbi:hypothetical protein D7B24_001670 [Verticillium nonalfalfae]|uniref:Uncharacterized protein n=1 Tax=Verticillium nonalfalfae TaxID=1051616 RepID=A0A3M9Y0L4_9PEZI|nr:uncharacterized protein D7B24_001670 [Verticillium nonalfalfae]RNJ53572.1 hypothetical protein D7B24_001670 [Verticillium nonalfalfae]